MFGLADRFDKPAAYSPGPGHYEHRSAFGTKGSDDLTTQLVQKLYQLPNDPLNLTSISVRSTRSTHFDDSLAARVARLETSLNCNRTSACAPGRRRGGGPSGVLASSSTEFQSAQDAGFQRHSWLAGELSGDVFCFKSTNTPINIGPGSYSSMQSTAPEKVIPKSHNYLVQRSEEIARNRRDLWIQKRLHTGAAPSPFSMMNGDKSLSLSYTQFGNGGMSVQQVGGPLQMNPPMVTNVPQSASDQQPAVYPPPMGSGPQQPPMVYYSDPPANPLQLAGASKSSRTVDLHHARGDNMQLQAENYINKPSSEQQGVEQVQQQFQSTALQQPPPMINGVQIISGTQPAMSSSYVPGAGPPSTSGVSPVAVQQHLQHQQHQHPGVTQSHVPRTINYNDDHVSPHQSQNSQLQEDKNPFSAAHQAATAGYHGYGSVPEPMGSSSSGFHDHSAPTSRNQRQQLPTSRNQRQQLVRVDAYGRPISSSSSSNRNNPFQMHDDPQWIGSLVQQYHRGGSASSVVPAQQLQGYSYHPQQQPPVFTSPTSRAFDPPPRLVMSSTAAAPSAQPQSRPTSALQQLRIRQQQMQQLGPAAGSSYVGGTVHRGASVPNPQMQAYGQPQMQVAR
ncbi:unnamed protein product [Amoebophrya sp. A120]|nr:unnamed protein product [Amoebophrya sp. A120]|eukprot:GSA120T00008337001.1